jgi:hypothetical protein
MTYEDAKSVLIIEGLGEDGLPVCCRMMDDPGRDRMGAVVEALRIVTGFTKEQDQLDRELCLAVWALGYHCDTQSQHWRGQSLEDEVIELVELAELFFQGNRQYS